MKKKLLSILLLFGLIAITLTGCGGNSTTKNNSSTEKNNNYNLGDTFTFDDLELTFDTTYSFATINNQFSDYNEASAIKLGVTVKNLSSENKSLNMFFYKFFGSQGTELDGVASYFDDSVDFAGELKPNASYKKYFYILYDGDGQYSIDFDNFSQESSVEFDVSK